MTDRGTEALLTMRNRIARYLADDATTRTLDPAKLDFAEIAALIAPPVSAPRRARKKALARSRSLGPLGWFALGLGVGLGATALLGLALRRV